ncbi:tetratricopeptide repeat protein [Thermodesulfobacteriota bacterium]
MVKQGDPGNEYVKKSTMLVFCFIALAAGFLGGVVLSVYKSGSAISLPVQTPQQQPAPPQGSSPQGSSIDKARIIQALEKETSRNPDNLKAWIELGNAFFDTSQFEKAIPAYEKSLALNPNNADVQTDLGVMYRRSKQPQKAIVAFDKAIEIDPRHEASRFNKGIVLMHDLKDLQGAIKVWEDLVKINPLAKSPSGIPIKEMIEKMKQSANQ